MTDRECLRRVELPLAMPVVIAGIRTATVWVVGTATLATPVGAPSLGNYIFMGLQTRNWEAVSFGCAFVALLAIALDQGVHALERAARTRNRTLGWSAGALLATLVLAGLAPLVSESLGGRSPAPTASPQASAVAGGAAPLAATRWVIGSKGFTEQYILAELLRRQLEERGATVGNKPNLGSTILFDALREDTVDVAVDYSGTIWTTVMKREEPASRERTIAAVTHHLAQFDGIAVLGPLGFENAYALAMDPRRAAALGVRSIADLAPRAGELTVGGDPEVFGRPEWLRVREAYGLEDIRTRVMDSTFLYGAVRDGEVDVITAYSTDGRIAAYRLTLLADPRQAFPPYDALLLVSPRAARDPRLVAALRPLVNAIDDATMRAANRAVDVDGRSPAEVGERLWRQLFAGGTERGHPRPDPWSGAVD
jgi:osmoprotectant transport system permease protein